MIERYDVIVIGAGPAGTLAARRARELGARTAIVDKHRTGGTCVNTGCVPTRVLAKTARLLRDIRGALDYGIVVSEPEVIWRQTLGRVRQVIAEMHANKRDEERLLAAGADLFLNEFASFRSPHQLALLGSGRVLEADQFIVCVGGRSRRLAVPGIEHAIYPEDILKLEALPRRVAVVGSGYTGVQLVTVLNALSCEVTLLEVLPEILPGADVDVGRVLAESFRRRGVVVETEVERIDGIEASADNVRRLSYTKQNALRQVECEAVIVCAGWPAATEGLGLEQAGVYASGNYIAVNEYLQTNVPHIFVAGDASGRGMLVQAAHFEAQVAAENAARGPLRQINHALMPSGGFTDPDHAGVGLTEKEARRLHPDCLVERVPYADLERAIIDRRTTGFFKLIAERENRQLLGAHAAGENAVEVIQAVAMAMAGKVDLFGLASVELAYPTYTAITGIAARRMIAAAG